MFYEIRREDIEHNYKDLTEEEITNYIEKFFKQKDPTIITASSFVETPDFYNDEDEDLFFQNDNEESDIFSGSSFDTIFSNMKKTTESNPLLPLNEPLNEPETRKTDIIFPTNDIIQDLKNLSFALTPSENFIIDEEYFIPEEDEEVMLPFELFDDDDTTKFIKKMNYGEVSLSDIFVSKNIKKIKKPVLYGHYYLKLHFLEPLYLTLLNFKHGFDNINLSTKLEDFILTLENLIELENNNPISNNIVYICLLKLFTETFIEKPNFKGTHRGFNIIENQIQYYIATQNDPKKEKIYKKMETEKKLLKKNNVE